MYFIKFLHYLDKAIKAWFPEKKNYNRNNITWCIFFFVLMAQFNFHTQGIIDYTYLSAI